MVAVALAAIGLEMDRQTRIDGRFAHQVPAAFRGQALESLAREAYANGDTAHGLAYSRELVLRRPVSADGLSLLTQGSLQAGQDDQALSALILAARRGWRDTYTQVLFASSALQAGDLTAGAQRVVALWRQGKTLPEKEALTKVLLQQDGGAQALNSVLVKSDTWATSFFIWAKDAGIPDAAIDRVSRRLADLHVEIYCENLSMPMKAMALQGRSDLADALWSRHCSNGLRQKRDDFAFNVPDASGPYDWSYPQNMSMRVHVTGASDALVVAYNNSDFIQLVIARRIAVLPSGTHTLRLYGSFSPSRMSLRIRCHDRDGQLSELLKEPFANSALTFEIPASCLAQEIELISAHGEGTLKKLTVDRSTVH
ncbi:hypothetical protein MTR62_04205 [Novosphingobium sp. 1949]|uniref:Uncharacterized protein n=1 Tax=Novosphingobium organovorum TaxID=2930092 RepID=A0ABT0BA40_9SPHN|nr:hypothetical protein [Novosphingobium organovorum]MCJ2181907.1 hypothetical protein [Novosphingobium organovorum]